MINSDLLNSEKLDENFSGAIGSCGLPPTCLNRKVITTTKRSCTKVLGRNVCVNKPVIKTETNQACIDSKARYRKCKEENIKKLADKIKKNIKDAGKNIKDTTKDAKGNIIKNIKDARKNIKDTTKAAGKNIKDNVKDAGKNIKETLGKVVKTLKEKGGNLGKNFRNRFRGLMRRGILFNIKNNIHGTATKLYPAIGGTLPKAYKKSYANASKRIYAEVLKKWKNLGGNEADLNSAITKGYAKRKFLKAPFKSATGDDSYSMYVFYTPSNQVYWLDSLDDRKQYTMYHNGDGEEDLEGLGDYSSSIDGVTNPETGEEEVVSQEEEVKGIRAFFAWFRNLFRRITGKDNENPFEEGTTENEEYTNEQTGDEGNQPDESEANDQDILALENQSQQDDAGGDTDQSAGDENKKGDLDKDKILGIPKTAFWIGVSAIALIGGFLIYKKFIAKK